VRTMLTMVTLAPENFHLWREAQDSSFHILRQ
jgi:hypothetical protein